MKELSAMGFVAGPAGAGFGLPNPRNFARMKFFMQGKESPALQIRF
jgi:hypothetical protein